MGFGPCSDLHGGGKKTQAGTGDMVEGDRMGGWEPIMAGGYPIMAEVVQVMVWEGG